MPLPEWIGKCLHDVTAHCESLQAQYESMRSENEALKVKLASAKEKPRTGGPSAAVVPVAWDDQEKTVGDDCVVESATVTELKSTYPSDGIRITTSSVSIARFAYDEIGDESHLLSRTHTETLAVARLGLLSSPREGSVYEMKPLGGFTEAMHMLFDKKTHHVHGPLPVRIVSSFSFRSFSILAIMGNALYIGAAADHQVKNSYRRIQGQPMESEWVIPNILFAAWFSIELSIRITADRWQFIFGEDRRWNLFDAFLVLNSMVELLFPFGSNFSFLRILRVFRLVRVVKVVRTVPALKSLRTMVFALMNSFVCLVWAFVMIILIMFVFGIIFENAVVSHYDTLDPGNPGHIEQAAAVNLYFGSMYETCVTLFCSITGGNDWMAYGEQLRTLENGEFYFAIFAFYVAFCLVGMLNVVTGIFVDSAVCTRTDDEVVECFTDEQKRISEEVRRIFKDADVDESGTVNIAELSKHLENPWVKAYFSGMDIDPSEANIIFTLIDKSGTGEVRIDEFVDGTMKLKGHAKSIDVLSMMFDSVRLSAKVDMLCAFVEEQLVDIRGMVVGSISGSDSGTESRPRLFAPLHQCSNKLSQMKLSALKEHRDASKGVQLVVPSMVDRMVTDCILPQERSP